MLNPTPKPAFAPSLSPLAVASWPFWTRIAVEDGEIEDVCVKREVNVVVVEAVDIAVVVDVLLVEDDAYCIRNKVEYMGEPKCVPL